MHGVLVEITPTGRANLEAVRFEGNPGYYGRYEVLRNCRETDSLIRQFEREMRDRYERVAPRFDVFAPTATLAIKKVIYNNPATIVIWSDGTKTVVKCKEGDTYSKELGLAMCLSKKCLGDNYHKVFKEWVPEETEETLSVEKKRYAIYKYCSARRCDECEINRLYDPRPGSCFDTDEDVIKHYDAIKKEIMED